MNLLLFLIIIATLTSIPGILFKFASSMILLVAAMSFVFGLAGALLMVPLKSCIDNIAMKKTKQDIFYRNQGKFRCRTDKERYVDYCLEDNILVAQTCFCLMGACLTYIFFGMNPVLLGIFIFAILIGFIYFNIIRYYEMVKDEMYVDMLTESFSDEGCI